MEDKCLLFDVEFLKSISDPSFVQEYNKTLQTFLSLLNDNMKTGMAPGRLNAKPFLDELPSPPLVRSTHSFTHPFKIQQIMGGEGRQ
jgi:hypothetical protein